MTSCKECEHMSSKVKTVHKEKVPRCMKYKELVLPYHVENVEGVLYAIPDGRFPSWCPLEDKKVARSPVSL